MTESNDYEKILVSQAACGHCDVAKNILKDKISDGSIIVKEVDTDKELMKWAEELGIEGTPAIVLKDKVTQLTKVCNLSADGTKAICNDGEVDL